MSDGLKVLLGVLGGAIVVLLLFGVFSGGGRGYGMGSMRSGGMMGVVVGGLYMLLFWALVIALIVAVVVWIVNQAQRR